MVLNRLRPKLSEMVSNNTDTIIVRKGKNKKWEVFDRKALYPIEYRDWTQAIRHAQSLGRAHQVPSDAVSRETPFSLSKVMINRRNT